MRESRMSSPKSMTNPRRRGVSPATHIVHIPPKCQAEIFPKKFEFRPLTKCFFIRGKLCCHRSSPKRKYAFPIWRKKSFAYSPLQCKMLLTPFLLGRGKKLGLLPLHLPNKNRLCSATRGIDNILKKSFKKKTDWIPRQIEFIESKRNKGKPEWVLMKSHPVVNLLSRRK